LRILNYCTRSPSFWSCL